MLEISGISKSFRRRRRYCGDVSLSVAPGEVVVVIGPSGSGKTTLLRCINLLEDYESGTIAVDGEPIGYRLEGGTTASACPSATSPRRARGSAWCSRASTCSRI